MNRPFRHPLACAAAILITGGALLAQAPTDEEEPEVPVIQQVEEPGPPAPRRIVLPGAGSQSPEIELEDPEVPDATVPEDPDRERREAADRRTTPSRPDPLERDPRLAGLLRSSPFLPEGFRPPGEAARREEAPPQRAVELRGIYELGGEVHVNLFNLGTQKGEWLKVGEQRGPYHVQRFDSARNMVFVTVGGRAEEIALKKPTDQPIPVQTAPAAPVPAPGGAAVAQAGAQAGAAPGSPVPRPRRIVLPPTTPGAEGAAAPGTTRRGTRRTPIPTASGAPSPGGTTIQVDVPDPTQPQPQLAPVGTPTDAAPTLRSGRTDTPAGSVTPEQLLQMLQSRSAPNP